MNEGERNGLFDHWWRDYWFYGNIGLESETSRYRAERLYLRL
jgi:hypothetical protein